METTTNYKLPQWVKADQIKMDDFNDAFGKIDAQMKKNADKANAAAGSSVSDAGKIELLCDDKNLGELGNATGGRASTVAWIFPAYRGVGAGYHTPTQNRNSSYEGVSGALLNEDAAWNSMQSLTLKFTGRKGASCVLYGLKA